jgi:hypothetical protein
MEQNSRGSQVLRPDEIAAELQGIAPLKPRLVENSELQKFPKV